MKLRFWLLLPIIFISFACEHHDSHEASPQIAMEKQQKLKETHNADKGVSAVPIFKGVEGKTMALQILKDQQLKEHITEVPALLVCVSGEVIFENEKGAKIPLASGEFLQIEPKVKHWVNGVTDSQLLLIK